jgi:malonyl-CoA O-methyltransferase
MLDKAKIKTSFSRHAETYDQIAGLQQEIGLQLISQIKPSRQPMKILDIGMGTGFLARELCRHNHKLKVFGCDIAHGMNLYASRQSGQAPPLIYPLTADAEYLCYKEQQIDLIISNLSYQWLNDIGQGLSEARRVLKPGGRLLLTTFGEKTLQELRDCFFRAYREKRGQIPVYTHQFIKKTELLQLMHEAGFGEVRVESRFYYRYYDGLHELLWTLKQLGATNASLNRPPGLASKTIIRRTRQLYEQKYGMADRIKASYEVLFVRGKKKRFFRKKIKLPYLLIGVIF